MVEKDFSKCQCPKAGWCDLLQKEMTATPPNWQWCQGLTEEERKQYHDKVNGKVRTIRKAIKAGLVDIVNFVDDIPTPTSDYAICVIPANQSAMDLLEVTRDSIKSYAKKCGADYIELTGDQHPDWPMANKWRVHSVTSVYKKTLYLDCDIFVKPESPNIFEITPDNQISAYDEWEVWEGKKQTEWIQREQNVVVRKTLDKDTKNRLIKNGKFTANAMINGGVMVIPQSLSSLYKQPETTYPRQWCFDQHYISLVLDKSQFHNLDKKFNLEYVREDFFDCLDDSYFIHVNNLRNDSKLRIKTLQDLAVGEKLVDYKNFDKTLKLGFKDSGSEHGSLSHSQVEHLDISDIEFNDEISDKTSDYAVCTINTDEFTNRQLAITRPKIEQYAKMVGADYIELRGDLVPEYPMYNKFRLNKVLNTYKKTLYLDCDIVINPDTPNIFDLTPDDKISAHEEYSFLILNESTKTLEYEARIIKEHLQIDSEIQRYINGGVMVIPQCMSDYYRLPDIDSIPKLHCFDQILVGFYLGDEHFYELGNKWNCSFKHVSFKEYNEHANFLHFNNPLSNRIPSLNWYTNKSYEGLYTNFGAIPTKECAHHRSGWNSICTKLLDMNSDRGIYLDCFLENTFAWKKNWYRMVSHVPYTMPWVGFFHNPPVYPEYFLKIIPDRERFGLLEDMISCREFRESADNCHALFTLSSYLSEYLRSATGLPTVSFKHPIPKIKFPEWKPDLAKKNREISMIGYWYRKFDVFLQLNTTWKKSFLGGNREQLEWYLENECKYTNVYLDKSLLNIYPALSTIEYDKHLEKSVVFLDFWDTACNTSLVDCISRNTPAVILKHPATIEYLGEDYPLFFENVQDANEIMLDFDRIVSGHEYLKNMDKSDLSEDYFFYKIRNWNDYIER